MSRLVLIAVASVIAMLIAAQLTLSGPLARNTAAESKPAIQVMAASGRQTGDGEETRIARDATGQFRITAQVNGQDARFLVDTGADMVALTVDDARNLRVDFNPDEFEPIAQTASGVAKGERVHLERLQLGDEEFRDVDAIVLEGLGTNLLGQSMLRRLGKVELRGDHMIIRHAG